MLRNEVILLTNKGSQKEACWFSTGINFDSLKCDVTRIMTRIDSVILVKSEILSSVIQLLVYDVITTLANRN